MDQSKPYWDGIVNVLKYYIIILFKTDEFIIEEPLLKKKNKKGEEKRTDFVENDEHEGMDY